MTDVHRREVHRVVAEWVVPTRDPYGACWTEVMLAIRSAIRELREAGRCGPDDEPAADAITIHPGDDDVVVRIVLSEQAVREGS